MEQPSYLVDNSCAEILEHPDRIFNVDETSFCVNPKLGKVLAKRGANNVYRLSIGSEKDCYTALIGGNAAGQSTPPLLVFAGKRLPNQINTYLPSEWQSGVSESGWMNSDIFYEYVTNKFYPWMQQLKIPTPVILFVDGHTSHRSLRLSEFCLENRIILVSLLPNSTHLLQPMDVVVFGPMKRKWSTMLQNFKRSNNEMGPMPKHTFVKLLQSCLQEIVTPGTLKSSFQKTALYPFNANNFDYSQLPLSESNSDVQLTDTSFKASLEQLIDSILPGKMEEFNNAGDLWTGDTDSSHLFLLWKAARGGLTNEVEEAEVDEEEGEYELLDVVDNLENENELNTSDTIVYEPIATSSSANSLPILHQEDAEDDSEDEANLTSEVRNMIARAQQNESSDEENQPSNMNVSTVQSRHKSTNPIISSPPYIAAMKHVKEKKEAEERQKKIRREARLDKAKQKLEKMQQNIDKLQKQVHNDKK
ncbi:uncharacterized protein LOC116348181 [Contarinia nasturtii]|uniref:uncharacterized protein LOC116348181 n=1 Tax=Contarinia nasturtii TaxID=265458 RepID=UPI0012D418A3|nr:uncharacterized protein LOC116348181 [Contarinia nasturtii]